MAATKFQTPYAKATKENGQPLDASDWNALSQAAHDAQVKINDVIDDIANLPAGGGGSSSGGSSEPSTPSNVVSVSSKGNTTISATKHINIEPAYVPGGGSGTYGDVQIKPGDDITLESHHRALDKQDEITVKTSDGKDGSKAPVRLQVIASDVTLSTKGKVVPQGSNDDPEVMNVRVSTGNGKGYLKVRARAIDLRCEEHGGIALQPFGNDGQGHENKIKFEHGGGDGKEFFTMNTEKMSAYVDEYRFKKTAKWKMATRVLLDNSEDAETDIGNRKFKDGDDETKHYSYEKQEDDFYDVLDDADPQCSTEDLITTSHALNGAPGVHTQITDKGNVEIETNEKYIEVDTSDAADVTIDSMVFNATPETAMPRTDEIFTPEQIVSLVNVSSADALGAALAAAKHGQIIAVSGTITLREQATTLTKKYMKIARGINIESCAGIKLKGTLDFGSTFNFGETDNGIEVQYKLTKKNVEKDCGVLRVVGFNNHASNNLVVEGETIAPGETAVIAECPILDIIKLTNYMRDNNLGPWQSSQQSSGNELTNNPNTANPIVDNGGEPVVNP